MAWYERLWQDPTIIASIYYFPNFACFLIYGLRSPFFLGSLLLTIAYVAIQKFIYGFFVTTDLKLIHIYALGSYFWTIRRENYGITRSWAFIVFLMSWNKWINVKTRGTFLEGIVRKIWWILLFAVVVVVAYGVYWYHRWLGWWWTLSEYNYYVSADGWGAGSNMEVGRDGRVTVTKYIYPTETPAPKKLGFWWLP